MSLLFLIGADSTGFGRANVLAWDVVASRVRALSEARYALGATVRLRAKFGDPEALLTDGEASPVDPGLVVFTTRDPLGVEAVVDPHLVIREFAGCYSALLTADVPGEWAWRVEGQGIWLGAAEGSFLVAPTAV